MTSGVGLGVFVLLPAPVFSPGSTDRYATLREYRPLLHIQGKALVRDLINREYQTLGSDWGLLALEGWL